MGTIFDNQNNNITIFENQNNNRHNRHVFAGIEAAQDRSDCLKSECRAQTSCICGRGPYCLPLQGAWRIKSYFLITIHQVFAIEGVFQLEPLGYFQMGASITSIGFRRDATSVSLLVALGSDQLLLLGLDDLVGEGSSELALALDSYCTSKVSLPGSLDVERGLVLITATYKQERADTIMLVYSSHEKTQLLEVKITPDGELVSSSPALELPRPPRRSKVTRLRFWPTDSFLLLGYSNGVFRIMDIRSQTAVSTWSQGLNDPATGEVTDIHPLEGEMVTSGKDGTLFTHKLAGAIFECAERVEMEEEQRQRLEEEERPPSVQDQWKSLGGKVGVPETAEVDMSKWDNVHDIEDPNHLCLEDMRLKEGEEKTNKLMEDKMLRIQKDISNLKRDFKKIQQRNENLHREYQVPKEKFQMTDFTYKLIQEEIEAKMKEVVKSMEAETEESKKVLENIRKRFFDPIQFNRVVVKGLKSKQELTTFRIAKMKPNDGKGEQAVDSIMVEHQTPDSWTPRTPPASQRDQSDGGNESSEGKLNNQTK